MAVYAVTWDLNREGSGYSAARAAFVQHLERFDHIKDPGLDSVRFIATTMSPDEVDIYLRQKLDTNDRLFVSRVRTGEHQGWLAKNVWNWINARI
jgi:hypothetical protein